MEKHKFKVGSKYKIDFGPGNLSNKTIRVLSIVNRDWIVFKHWERRKRYWNYQISNRSFFDLLIEKGEMKKVK